MFYMSKEQYAQALQNNLGLCIQCYYTDTGGIEPDDEERACDSCDHHAVMGVRTALAAEYISIEDEE